MICLQIRFNPLFANQANNDWYICANTQCNHLTELKNLLDFTKRYPENQSMFVIGFGNEGIMDLAGFFQKHTILDSSLWLIPVSIRSLSRALTPQRTISAATESCRAANHQHARTHRL